MPEAVVSGGVIILGSRTELPPGSSSLSPVKPLQVNIAGGSLTVLTSGHTTKTATILNNETVYDNGSATLDIGYYQNLMVDIAFGTVVSGSIDITVSGFVPVVDLPGSTILDSGWFAGTVQTTQNLQVTEPLGSNVVVSWNVVGSVTNMYLFGEMVT